MDLINIPLRDISAGKTINARRTGKKDGLVQLQESLLALGLLQPLAVRPKAGGKGFEVIDGNRRFAALIALCKSHPSRFDLDTEIPVLVRHDDESHALEASLAANIVRVPLHPVDQYETLAALGAMSPSEIAMRFGLPERQVRQALALGKLHPDIRSAWRAAKISDDMARAYTLTDDQTLQLKAFEITKTQTHTSPFTVKSMLLGGSESLSGAAMTFVGLDHYQAEGGTIVEDLFTEERRIGDVTLLKVLLKAKLTKVCDDLITQGWRWSAIEEDLPRDSWNWPEIAVEPVLTPDEQIKLAQFDAILADAKSNSWEERNTARSNKSELIIAAQHRAVTPEQRASAGCVVSLGSSGRSGLQIKYGIIRPEDQTQQADDSTGADTPHEVSDIAAKAPVPERDISAALSQAVSEIFSDALAEAVARDQKLALSTLCVALLPGSYNSALRITSSGRGEGILKTEFEDLRGKKGTTLLDLVLALSDERRMRMLCALAGAAVDVTDATIARLGVSPLQVKYIADHTIAGLMEPPLKEMFKADEFFRSATKKVAIAALEEISGRNNCTSTKKDDIAQYAAKLATQSGWLPGQLRTKHYAGPGAKNLPHAIAAE